MLIRGLYGGLNITEILLTLVVFLLCISVHESAHAYIAYKMGDPTSKMMGRITLNPMAHIDWIGLLLLLFTGFGFAKPVPINTRNFRDSRKGVLLTALAGPVSNLIMAFFFLLIYNKFFSGEISLYRFLPLNFQAPVSMLLTILITLNITLAVFNLLPIPPLDGSKLLIAYAPYKWRNFIFSIEQYGIIILFVVIYALSDFIVMFSNAIIQGMSYVISLLPF